MIGKKQWKVRKYNMEDADNIKPVSDPSDRKRRRARINRMKTVIIVSLLLLILISVGLNIYLLIRVIHLSNLVELLYTQSGLAGLY